MFEQQLSLASSNAVNVECKVLKPNRYWKIRLLLKRDQTMHIWLKIGFWRRPMASIASFKEFFIYLEKSIQWFNSGWEKALRKNGRISSKLLNIANTNNHPLIKSAIWGLTMIVIYTSEMLNSGNLIWLDFRKIFVSSLCTTFIGSLMIAWFEFCFL